MEKICYSVQAIGQDSHRFCPEGEEKPLVLGGLKISGYPGLMGNSDADVLLHSLTNAISGITCRPVLGAQADKLCLDQGITDSKVYLDLALEDLYKAGYKLVHISFSVQAKRPRLLERIPEIRRSIARLTGLSDQQVMLTATSGEGLTAFGRGEGIEAFCVISAVPMTEK